MMMLLNWVIKLLSLDNGRCFELNQTDGEVNMSWHKIHYEVFNGHNLTAETEQHWEVEVHASPEELQAFVESGYMVRESLFQNEALRQFQDALDELEPAE